jgi:hypothetical protein
MIQRPKTKLPKIFRDWLEYLEALALSFKPIDGKGVRVTDVAGGRSVNWIGLSASGNGISSEYAPFGFIDHSNSTDGYRGEINYNSKLYVDTSGTTKAITGLQSPGTVDGYFAVSLGSKIYLEIEQDESLAITDATIKCDSSWSGDMFETDTGVDGIFVRYVRILLHNVLADTSTESGVTITNGTTALKVVARWTSHMDATNYFMENSLVTHKPLAHG